MKKIPKELLEQVLQVIALAIHPNQNYIQINQLIKKLNELEEIKEEVKE